jgi:hypothetical protein
VKISRRQLRQLILEVYKPGMERKIQRASVMDPDMLQSIDDLEASGVEGRRQAQDLALAMGSEEDEREFIDSETYTDIVAKNKPYKRNAEQLRLFLQHFVKMVTTVNSRTRGGPLYGRIPGVRGNPVNASPIKVGLADPQAFRDNLVGGDHAAAEVRLTVETVPDAEVVIKIEDNMFAYSRDVEIFLPHDENFVPIGISLNFTGSMQSMMDRVRDLDLLVRGIINSQILTKVRKARQR